MILCLFSQAPPWIQNSTSFLSHVLFNTSELSKYLSFTYFWACPNSKICSFLTLYTNSCLKFNMSSTQDALNLRFKLQHMINRVLPCIYYITYCNEILGFFTECVSYVHCISVTVLVSSLHLQLDLIIVIASHSFLEELENTKHVLKMGQWQMTDPVHMLMLTFK